MEEFFCTRQRQIVEKRKSKEDNVDTHNKNHVNTWTSRTLKWTETQKKKKIQI